MSPANPAMGAQDDMSMGDQPESNSPDAAPQDGAEQGYEINICVYADGTFRVKKGPLESESAESADAGQGQPDEAGDQVASFEDALRSALKLFKSNPVGNSDQAQFESGFGKPKEKY